MDFTLNNQQRLICHKTQTNKQTNIYDNASYTHTHAHTNIYHYHHAAPTARISMTHSPHSSLWSIASDRSISCIGTELLYIGSYWSFKLSLSMWWGSQEYVAYGFVFTSPAVSHMSSLSNFDSFRDGWSVAVQLLFCRVLYPGLVQYCWQHSCVIAIKIFLHTKHIYIYIYIYI